MYLSAVHTLASAAGIWAIVIVAVVCLAFWLTMVVTMAQRGYARDERRQRHAPQLPHVGERDLPVVGGMHAGHGGRSLGPTRDEPATAMPEPAAARETVMTPAGTATPEGAGAPEGTGTEVTRDDIASVPGPRSSRPAPQPAGPSPLDLGGPVGAREPGAAWTAPRQRESETDQPARSRPPDGEGQR
jgi:hypothetical protein